MSRDNRNNTCVILGERAGYFYCESKLVPVSLFCKQMKEIIIPVDIYKAKIRIWVCSPKECEEEIKKSGHFDKDDPSENTAEGLAGRLWFTEGLQTVLWVREDLSVEEKLGTLVHELYHWVNRLFAYKGLDLDYFNDEAHAYLLEYVFTRAVKKMKLVPLVLLVGGRS